MCKKKYKEKTRKLYDLNEWTGCKRHENIGCIKSKVQMRKRARWTE